MKQKNSVSPKRLKTKAFLLVAMLSVCSLSSKAQFVVTDPANIATSIVNATN